MFNSQGYIAQAGTTFDPNGMIILVPGYTKQIVKLHTYGTDPGMIYYEIKNKPKGFNIENAKEVIAGAATAIIMYIFTRMAPGFNNLRMPSTPPVSA